MADNIQRIKQDGSVEGLHTHILKYFQDLGFSSSLSLSMMTLVIYFLFSGGMINAQDDSCFSIDTETDVSNACKFALRYVSQSYNLTNAISSSSLFNFIDDNTTFNSFYEVFVNIIKNLDANNDYTCAETNSLFNEVKSAEREEVSFQELVAADVNVLKVFMLDVNGDEIFQQDILTEVLALVAEQDDFAVKINKVEFLSTDSNPGVFQEHYIITITYNGGTNKFLAVKSNLNPQDIIYVDNEVLLTLHSETVQDQQTINPVNTGSTGPTGGNNTGAVPQTPNSPSGGNNDGAQPPVPAGPTGGNNGGAN